MTRFYGWLLLVEIIVVAAAPLIFTTIHNRLIAGLLAGAIFVALGIFIFMIGIQVSAFRRTPTFLMGCVHLFASALPLLITRVANLSTGFEDVRVLGLAGPIFHNLATAIFAVLMLATIFDLVQGYRRDRRAGR